MICIRHATIFTPQQRLEDGSLLIQDGRVAAVGPADAVTCPPSTPTVDAGNLWLAPGLIDLQLNGAFGRDFTADPPSIWEVAARLPALGVTAFLPTIITSPLQTVARAQAALKAGPQKIERSTTTAVATPLGLHIEGPFLNPAKKGAHDAALLRLPSLDAVQDWSPNQGVRLVTMAPELPGALEVIAALSQRGIVVSAGHSLATYEEAMAAFQAGVRYGTHLFNAMPPLHHRKPGLVGALLDEPEAAVGLIVDGYHLHPALVRLVWRRLADKGRLTLVTDAMAALGLPPGDYRLGGVDVFVGDGTSRLADGTLAGSIVTPLEALRRLMAFTGCSFAEALPTFTSNPARLLGLSRQKGRIAPGFDADLLLLTPDLDVRTTLIDGQIAYGAFP